MNSSRPNWRLATTRYMTEQESLVPLFLSLPVPARGPEDDRHSGCVPPHWRLGEEYQNASYYSRRELAWENARIFTQTLQHLYATFTAPL